MPLAGRDWSGAGGSTSVSAFLLAATCGTWRYTCGSIWMFWDFYSHAPYGTWQYSLYPRRLCLHFYSHAPCGTWLQGRGTLTIEYNFYSHAPCGTWLYCVSATRTPTWISTHTPLAGRDTVEPCTYWFRVRISTHTPLAGRDYTRTIYSCRLLYFYSHAPYGTWQGFLQSEGLVLTFLLTRPLRDVTWLEDTDPEYINISTHTPLAGRDLIRETKDSQCGDFYSHAPCGTWRRKHSGISRRISISTHTPLAGRDGFFDIFDLRL